MEKISELYSLEQSYFFQTKRIVIQSPLTWVQTRASPAWGENQATALRWQLQLCECILNHILKLIIDHAEGSIIFLPMEGGGGRAPGIWGEHMVNT